MCIDVDADLENICNGTSACVLRVCVCVLIDVCKDERKDTCTEWQCGTEVPLEA